MTWKDRVIFIAMWVMATVAFVVLLDWAIREPLK